MNSYEIEFWDMKSTASIRKQHQFICMALEGSETQGYISCVS